MNRLIQLPEKFIHTIMGVHQEKGALWLEHFEELIQYCENRWSFQVQAAYPLSFNFVAPVLFHNGTEAVLKLGVPNKELITEAEALRIYKGNGCARLWDADTDKGILILEKATPGHTLKTVVDDDEAVRLAAAVMRKLQVPPPLRPLFPSTADWAKGFDKLRTRYHGSTGPLPERMVRKAEEWFAKLHKTWRNPQLLHGDLHHENLLSAEREPYIAIDPKGLIGELEYGVISFLMNNLPEKHPSDIIRRRIELFSTELTLDPVRIITWGYCHAVLSAWWCVEDQVGDPLKSLELAAVFEKLLEEKA
ncbi:aminoglycoside phosphotransferase family protein [Paenibacillus periandrae]|uniref:aminoglycoside phosphotransferase family protein n=1 Tax=Paenibacillus periandrae TaxID=1761741 RepID=UPI001F09512E|nr:aminoglycoside phosphotransferase family protein [Paenibacillus periandrae]